MLQILYIKISRKGDLNMKWLKNHIWILNTVMFFVTFAIIFLYVSYLLRPVTVNRKNVVGYYAEDKNTLDVVFIGGSSTYVFWAPYEAWADFGMVSYDFSTDSMSPALLKGLLEEALKTQTPKLLVIDLRALEVRDVHEGFYSEAYLRNITDALKYSSTRAKTIEYAFKYEQPEYAYDISEYFDLCMYHSEWQELDEDNFLYSKNCVNADFKGFEMITFAFHQYYDKNDYTYVTNEIPLSDETNQILIDLLSYCREKNINVLFTLNPIYMDNEEIKARYNYVKRIVNGYGYDFINTNDYYDEMCIDFSHDFYNRDHVNLYGALKYTKFLGSYIVNHYDIPDRRGDSTYASWNDGYKLWNDAVINQKKLIDNAIAEKQQEK